MTDFRSIGFFILLSTFWHRASSLNCFDCNSANNSACIDIEKYDPGLGIVPIVNCEANVVDPKTVNFLCRKIVQTIFHNHREPELRVTRGCGWIRHHKDCYRADNSDHLETVCQCFHDGCNAGVANKMVIGLLFSLTTFVILM